MVTHSYTDGIELLPCPFCGGKNVKLYGDSAVTGKWIACISCGLEAPSETGVTVEQAITYWNTRASSADTIDPRVQDLADKIRVADCIARGAERFAIINIIVGERDRKGFADAILASARASLTTASGEDVAQAGRDPATIEACAKIAEAQKETFLSPQYASNQPFGSLCERFACDEVAKAIRDRQPVTKADQP